MRRARGFTLIEVMLAMVVFAIGFLGLAQLQVVAARSAMAARRTTEATAVANALATRLQNLSFTDALLNNSSTANDMPLDGSGTYNLKGVGAIVDHCIDSSTFPSGWVSCTSNHTSASLPGWILPADIVDQPGDPVQYWMAWDVQDANLRGDLKAGSYDAKIVVARVLWRDPALKNMRSIEVMAIVPNPVAARF